MSQNVPWGSLDVSCQTPRWKKVSGKVQLQPCGRILSEAKTPDEAKRLARMCDDCEKAADRLLTDYARGQKPVQSLFVAHTLNFFMFRGQYIVSLFARNYGYLRDQDGFKRWWTSNVHPATTGELTMDRFMKLVRTEYNRLQELGTKNIRPEEMPEPSSEQIHASLGIQVDEAVEEPTPEEIAAALPGGGAQSEVPPAVEMAEERIAKESSRDSETPPETEKERKEKQEKSRPKPLNAYEKLDQQMRSQGKKKPKKTMAARKADTPAAEAPATEEASKAPEEREGSTTPRLTLHEMEPVREGTESE